MILNQSFYCFFFYKSGLFKRYKHFIVTKLSLFLCWQSSAQTLQYINDYYKHTWYILPIYVLVLTVSLEEMSQRSRISNVQMLIPININVFIFSGQGIGSRAHNITQSDLCLSGEAAAKLDCQQHLMLIMLHPALPHCIPHTLDSPAACLTEQQLLNRSQYTCIHSQCSTLLLYLRI